MRPRERLQLAGRLAVSLVLNGLALSALFYAAFYESEPPPAMIEIPVEMAPPPEEPQPQPQAQETPPQPEQEKPKPPPQPQQNTLDEKPATDAPRAESKENIERDAPDKATGGPRQAEKPAEAPATGPRESNANASPEQPDDKADADALRNVAPERAPEPKTAARRQADPKKGSMSSEELLSAFQPMPEFEFGSAGKRTSVAGGAARSTYLTVLFGMVVPHMRVPPGTERLAGEVAFGVDEWGQLTYVRVRRPSGSQPLDNAAGAAVRAAAPFPPPPNHKPIGLSFTYGPR